MSTNDDVLQHLLDVHSRNVESSAKAWTHMVEAQHVCTAARKREHNSADAIKEHLKKRIRANVTNPRFCPVEIEIED